MKVSVCVTTFNEAGNIVLLLDSLLSQTKVPDEIIIVDAGSTDKTTEKIKKYKKAKLIVSKGASIAKGRNLAIKNARNEIIAMTDAGCICEKHWLERIINPFEKAGRDSSTSLRMTYVVAGFYKMSGDSNFQKALKPYLGIIPEKFDEKTFLPSTRSVAFRKSLWSEIGGFDERLYGAGEDTDFNIRLIKRNIKIVRVKNAIVEWEVPVNFTSALRKFFNYAKGDVQLGLLTSHNIKVLSIILRYLFFILFFPLFFIYLLWPLYKFRNIRFNWSSRLWTVIIQIGSDFSVMAGFISGIWDTLKQ